MKHYKEGMIFGAVVAFLFYITIPIYSDIGPASIFPTGNVVADSSQYNQYIANLPFSLFTWLSLEILGIAVGVVAQMIFRQTQTQ